MVALVDGRHAGHRKLNMAHSNNEAVEGQYIVYFNDDLVNAQGAVSSLLQSANSGRVRHDFGRLFNGLLLSALPDDALQLLLDSPFVREIYEVCLLNFPMLVLRLCTDYL